jgi:predicted small secreted protein
MKPALLAVLILCAVLLAAFTLAGCSTYQKVGTQTLTSVSITSRPDGSAETNVTVQTSYNSPALSVLKALAGAAEKAGP